MKKDVVRVSGLILNQDLPGSTLSDNVLTLGMNFVPVNNKLVATKASVPAPKNSANGPWEIAPADFVMITAGQTGPRHYFLLSGPISDYVFDGSSWVDVTSVDKVASSISDDKRNAWTTCKIGFHQVVNNAEFFPEVWSGQFGDKLRSLPFSPTATFKQANIKCAAIRSHKNFLIALNLVEKGEPFPYSYRWSHPADENGLPFSWDVSDLSTLASKESIGGDYGVVVDGLSLRDSFCIYAERAIHILDFTGDEFVFRRRLLTASYGCISQNCIVEAENLHYVMTTNDIVVNDGTSVQSLLTDNLKSVYANISNLYYRNSYAVINPAANEAWFCFPEGNYLFPSVAIVYNYVTKKFGVTRLLSRDNGVGTMSSITFGIMLPPAYPWDSLDSYFPDWDSWLLPVDSIQQFQGVGIDGEQAIPPITTHTSAWDNYTTPLPADLFCIGPEFYYIEQLNGSRVVEETGEGLLVTIFEKTNWAIGSQEDVKTMLRVYPFLQVVETSPNTIGEAKLFVGAHDWNNSEIRWDLPIIFNPKNDRKIDVRVTGELLAIRFEFRGYEEISMSGFDVEFAFNGVR